MCLLDPFLSPVCSVAPMTSRQKLTPKMQTREIKSGSLNTLLMSVVLQKEWQSAATNKHNKGQGQHRMKHKQYWAGLGQDGNGRDGMGWVALAVLQTTESYHESNQ